MKAKTFRLEEKHIELLKDYALRNSITQTTAIQIAIQNLGIAIQENSSSKAYEMLKNELSVKNKQIADLSAALLAAQDTAKAAQSLHAIDRKEDLRLESTEQKETRWSRLKSAWRG